MREPSSSLDPVSKAALFFVLSIARGFLCQNNNRLFPLSATQAVIARAYGGWARLCTESSAKGFRRDFARTWEAYFRQGVRLFGHLPGIIETTNRENGFYEHIPSPKLIGDPELAINVLKAAEESDMNSNPDAE